MQFDPKTKTLSQQEETHMRFRNLAIFLAIFALAGALQMWAQTITTGELAGTVTDPSGAVVANAPVQLKNLDEGSVNNQNTTSSGYYHFSYLKPGNYSVTVSAPGFQASEKKVIVALGAAASANFTLGVGSSSTTVEVTTGAQAIETEDANLTANFNSRQIEMLPNAGNDLSEVALTAPGVVMNSSGGAMIGGGKYEVNG